MASSVAVARLLEQSSGQCMSVAKMLELVQLGDRGAVRAVTDAGDAIGRAVAVFVNALNPEMVVVGGELAAAGESLLGPIRAAILQHAVFPAAARVKVVQGSLGDRAEVLGAAALLLDRAPAALAQLLAGRAA